MRKFTFQFNENSAIASAVKQIKKYKVRSSPRTKRLLKTHASHGLYYAPRFFTSTESFRIFPQEKIHIKLDDRNKLYRYSSSSSKRKYHHEKLGLELYNTSTSLVFMVQYGATLKTLLSTPLIYSLFIILSK